MNKFFKSFSYAMSGLVKSFSEQRNLKIHVIVSLFVIVLGFYFGITGIEWLIIVLTVGFVIVAELINTSIENIVNLVSPQHHELAGKAKDIAAAAVLIAAIVSSVVGIIIFAKYLFP